MYNSIYPININYRKNPYNLQGANSHAQNQNPDSNKNNLQKDTYTPSSNQINISQILMDFKNTILAINAPQDVQDEVNTYLNLVDKESKKENPSRDIIFSNLKNASKISDEFITGALNKKSNVVEGWISTIFRQNINLKADPSEINPDFLLKFPQKPEAKPVQEAVNDAVVVSPEVLPSETAENVQKNEEIIITQVPSKNIPEQTPVVEVDSSIESVQEDNIFITKEQKVKTPFSPNNASDEKAKVLYLQAKKITSSNADATDALNMLNDALGYLNDESNENIKAAIHFERGKIFDDFDYVDYALRDYFEATKASDFNLKANAYFKSGSIYDEFKEFDPALDNYLSSVAYSGEANNLSAQSKVLSKISRMYANKYDMKNAHDYADLAIDAAVDSQNNESIADAYSSVAQNYQHFGDNKKALENYKNALFEYSQTDESYEQMGYNYSQAAMVMRQLGNEAKAAKLQAKANQYYQKAQLQTQLLEQAG